MKKQNVMPVLVLTVICLAVAVLLAFVNMLTAPVIEEAEEQKKYESLKVVLDGNYEPVSPIPEDAPESVTAIYTVTENGVLIGHVVTLEVKGYASQISVTVGVDTENKVTKAVVTSEAESHGKPGMDNYTDNFTGVSSDKVADVELFSGATISSSAIKGAVIDAVNVVSGTSIEMPDNSDTETSKEPETLPKTDEEIIALAAELVGEGASFVDVTPSYNKPETLKRLYKETGGKGYVAYILTEGQYVPVANEGLIHINNDGDIENINHLTWIVGNEVSNEGFAEQFVGKDNWNLDEVELISSATVTSADFRNAVAEAMDVVTKTIMRTDEKLLSLVDRIVPNSKDFEELEIPEGAPETLKRLYRERSGKGYVAYIVTSGEYVAIATEGLVYYDTLGKILDVEILVWNVGHGIGPGDFDRGFVGKTKEDIDTVELVTAATGTSWDFKEAVIAAYPYIPTDFPIARVLGIVILAFSAIAVAVTIIIHKKRRSVK